MLGDTLTMTLGGSGGTAKVLNKINQDGYGAEYLLREATQQFTAKVSHSKNGTRDRHYVEFKQTVFATSTDPEIIRTSSHVLLASPSDTEADVTNLAEALAFWLDGTTVPKLIGWQS
ncbi:MAG: putative coat protein [Hampduvirus faecihabitans]|uniref:Coat protein n=1 Tax=Leviviridae sp. TaxID=2027243 RepID=A0ABY3SUA5_9VIRU|nr:MAG: putative coat protein [Leviviridae sp.]